MSKVDIPESFRPLMHAPGAATLSTLGADQSIQSVLVWFDYMDEQVDEHVEEAEGGCFRVNMGDRDVKFRNMQRHPKATLLIHDPATPDRYISFRCEFERFEHAGAIEHLDKLTQRNTEELCWYGGVVEDDPEERAHSIIVYLRPVRSYCFE